MAHGRTRYIFVIIRIRIRVGFGIGATLISQIASILVDREVSTVRTV